MNSISFHQTDQNNKALIPKRATQHSVGYDFFTPSEVVIEPGQVVVVDTGVKCEFPSDLWLGIYGRSSFARKGLVNPLGVGVVDSDYFGTGNAIGVALWNTSKETITIPAGEAIAQGIFHHVITAGDEVTTKRAGGFGSTDKTIEYGGHTLPYKRAELYVGDILFKGIVVDDTTEEGDEDLVFISDTEHPILHDGNDPAFDHRCWYTIRGNGLLEIID